MQDEYFIEYEYDAFGNRLKQNHNGNITTYAYNANDQLIEEHKPEGVIYYTWDANGNLVKKEGLGEVWEYEWDYDNKLLRALLNGEEVVRYVYDYEGNKVKEIKNTQEIDFLVDSNNLTGLPQVFRAVDISGEKFVNIFGDDLLLQIFGQKSFFHYDHLGTTKYLSDERGEIIDSAMYYAFGKFLSRPSQTGIRYFYTGEELEEDLNYYYLRSRHLDPEAGRFVSMDKIYFSRYIPTTLNRYAYVENNPVNLVDPRGYYSINSLLTTLNIVAILSSIGPSIIHPIFYYTVRRRKERICPCGEAPCKWGVWSGWSFNFINFGGNQYFSSKNRIGLNIFNFSFSYSRVWCWNQSLQVDFLTICGGPEILVFDIDEIKDVKYWPGGNISTAFLGIFCFTECKSDFRGLTLEISASPRSKEKLLKIGTHLIWGMTGGGVIIGFSRKRIISKNFALCSRLGFGAGLLDIKGKPPKSTITPQFCYTLILK